MVEVEQVSPQVLVLNKRRYVLSRAKTKPKKKKRTAAEIAASRKRALAKATQRRKRYAKMFTNGTIARMTFTLPPADKEKLVHLCDITGYSMGSVISALLSTATATQIRNAQPQSAVSQARAAMLLLRANKLGVTP